MRRSSSERRCVKELLSATHQNKAMPSSNPVGHDDKLIVATGALEAKVLPRDSPSQGSTVAGNPTICQIRGCLQRGELVATRDERCGSGGQLHRAGAVGDSEERLNGWPGHPLRDPLALATVESRASARRLSRIACCRCLPPTLMFLSVIVIDSSDKVFRCEAQLVKNGGAVFR